jgi:SRSO17 transposase
MKPSDHTISQSTRTTLREVVQWNEELERLHTRIAPRFVRPEPCLRVLAYLRGLLSEIPRKNGWQLAEHAREARPDGMQRLLDRAVWDADLVRDDLRAYVLEQLGHPQAILAIDETSFPKRGHKSAGVQRQYCGTTGQRENCQVGVFLSYVSEKGHTLLDRELYLPKRWINHPEWCREAGVPETTGFQTKCELARKMVERVRQAQIPISWVVADTVYGNNFDLREWLEQSGYHYVLAVACKEEIEIQTTNGRQLLQVREVETRWFPVQEWQRLSMGQGSKGPRWFDWAVVPILHRGEQDGQHWLLIRRHPSDLTDQQYYFVFGPKETTLTEMVEAIGARWHIEEDFETSKDLGLDQYEVRTWRAWYRHITLVLLALAFLTGICAHEQTAPAAEQDLPLLPVTRPEVAHLLGQLLWPPPHSALLLLAWSWWRRCHRSRASYYHTKRRLKG